MVFSKRIDEVLAHKQTYSHEIFPPKGDLPLEEVRKVAAKDAVVGSSTSTMRFAPIDRILISALDEAGERVEKGIFFFPQLMASTEAVKAGFDAIKLGQDSLGVLAKGEIALCIVRGDIHDIGKNIVKILLENYGYRVYDAGYDVGPQLSCDLVVEHHLKIVFHYERGACNLYVGHARCDGDGGRS